MDVGLFIAASGMVAEQTRQDQLANDLSNATTPGYKADASPQHSFGAVLLATTRAGGAPRTTRAARLRDRGPWLLRGARRPGHPLPPQRPVHRVVVGDPDRR